jgi:hypothetical protein
MTNLESERNKEAINPGTCIWTEHCSTWERMIPEFVQKSLVYDEGEE